MPIQPLDIFSYYNKQRFIQAGSMDCANFYEVEAADTKAGKALYPAMGRKKIEFNNDLKLLFDAEPRELFSTVDYCYVVEGARIFQVDKGYNKIELSEKVSRKYDIRFAYLNVGVFTYIMLTDGVDIFVITEELGKIPTIAKCTDTNRPSDPSFVTAFGDRFIVGTRATPKFTISNINLKDPNNPSVWFTTGSASLFAQASGVIKQLAVLHNQLFIFTDFTVDIWSNIPTQLQVGASTEEFPFKKSTAYSWDYGIADSDTLSVDFGMMVWLGKNRSGLATFLVSNGGPPQQISTQAVNVLLETSVEDDAISPFLNPDASGFLYQWENTIFYRVVAGKFLNFGDLDLENSANAIEFNFRAKKWSRVIEKNGERNRIQKHIYFNNKHLVAVEDQSVIFEMRGDVYSNEIQLADNPTQFTVDPMRYELTTKQIYQQDYSEFITEYLQIDMVWGNQSFVKNNAPFDNTVFVTDESGKFIVTEDSEEGSETFLIQEGTNTPNESSSHYNSLFKPHIELYFSDDGGETFNSADLREFSQLGVYSWRMRWYKLGNSRNRVYKLICVSSAPIVILGAVHNLRRSSGGAN